MKKIISLCIGSVLMLSVFTISVNAASKNFSFYFDGAILNGDVNGVFYEIGNDKVRVNAKGNWHLRRDKTIGSQSATCSISLRRVTFWTDEDFGSRSIGTVSIANGYSSGSYKNFDVSWTSGVASDEYYLVTTCGSVSSGTYKEGSGTLTY